MPSTEKKHSIVARPVIAAAALAIAALVPSLARAGDSLKPGDAFPRLDSFALEGTVPDLGAARVTIVDFWASWCAPCKASFPVMEPVASRQIASGIALASSRT